MNQDCGRIMRAVYGGSWTNIWRCCAFTRFRIDSDGRSANLGFRISTSTAAKTDEKIQ